MSAVFICCPIHLVFKSNFSVNALRCRHAPSESAINAFLCAKGRPEDTLSFSGFFCGLMVSVSEMFVQNVNKEDRAAGETANVLAFNGMLEQTRWDRKKSLQWSENPMYEANYGPTSCKGFRSCWVHQSCYNQGKDFAAAHVEKWVSMGHSSTRGHRSSKEAVRMEFTRIEQILHYSTLHWDRHTNLFTVFCRCLCQSGGIFCLRLCLPSNSSESQLPFDQSKGCSSQSETHFPQIGTPCCCAGRTCNDVCVFSTESPNQWHVSMEWFPTLWIVLHWLLSKKGLLHMSVAEKSKSWMAHQSIFSMSLPRKIRLIFRQEDYWNPGNFSKVIKISKLTILAFHKLLIS